MFLINHRSEWTFKYSQYISKCFLFLTGFFVAFVSIFFGYHELFRIISSMYRREVGGMFEKVIDCIAVVDRSTARFDCESTGDSGSALSSPCQSRMWTRSGAGGLPPLCKNIPVFKTTS